MIARPSIGPISSKYGYRKVGTEPVTLHSGIDFVGATGSPIRAVKNGTVIVAAPNGTYNKYGNVVVIKHDDPTEAPYSLYAHMSSLAVRKGQHVLAGRKVGGMGNFAATRDNPNNRVATHLHFELLKRWPAPPDVDRVDPTPFLPGAAPVPAPGSSGMYSSWYTPSNITPAYVAPAPAPSYASADPWSYASLSGLGIADPASQNCIDKGGKETVVNTPAGQSGVCTFPDGSSCESWALFRGTCAPGRQKRLTAFLVGAAVAAPLSYFYFAHKGRA